MTDANSALHTAIAEGMQPGSVEWELNRRRELKLERAAVRHMAELEATREQREREPRSVWRSLVRIFRRYWPE